MSMCLCSVCGQPFDPKVNDLAIFEPEMICGSCVEDDE